MPSSAEPDRLPTDRSSARSSPFIRSGEVAEWLKVRDWKSRVPERVPRVRIPLSPLQLRLRRFRTHPSLRLQASGAGSSSKPPIEVKLQASGAGSSSKPPIEVKLQASGTRSSSKPPVGVKLQASGAIWTGPVCGGRNAVARASFRLGKAIARKAPARDIDHVGRQIKENQRKERLRRPTKTTLRKHPRDRHEAFSEACWTQLFWLPGHAAGALSIQSPVCLSDHHPQPRPARWLSFPRRGDVWTNPISISRYSAGRFNPNLIRITTLPRSPQPRTNRPSPEVPPPNAASSSHYLHRPPWHLSEHSEESS